MPPLLKMLTASLTAIALGSNVGDRWLNLKLAKQKLEALYGAGQCSRVYETAAVDCEPGTMAYLNAVVEIHFKGEPLTLLKELQSIEIEMGRPSRHPHHAPRTIDLDILFMGDLVYNSDSIQIPHPRLHVRRFVLAPLCDIWPDLILPGQKETVKELLEKLPEHPWVSVFQETI